MDWLDLLPYFVFSAFWSHADSIYVALQNLLDSGLITDQQDLDGINGLMSGLELLFIADFLFFFFFCV